MRLLLSYLHNDIDDDDDDDVAVVTMDDGDDDDGNVHDHFNRL